MLSRKGLTRFVFVLLYCFPNTYMKSCSVFVQVYYLSKDCKRKTGRKCFSWLLPQHLARGLTVESGKDLVMNRMSQGPESPLHCREPLTSSQVSLLSFSTSTLLFPSTRMELVV